ncbi:hypothetical protein ACFSTC_52870 [Nonomuraea ferruginea]
MEILRDLMGVDVPVTPLIRVEDSTFNTRPSGDFEADLVLVMGPPQSPAHAIIVEIQQDKSKAPHQLARYAAALWLLLGCDVTVLVICPDRAAAAYYAQPIDSGLTGYRLQAHVLGPDDIPAITDPPPGRSPARTGGHGGHGPRPRPQGHRGVRHGTGRTARRTRSEVL